MFRANPETRRGPVRVDIEGLKSVARKAGPVVASGVVLGGALASGVSPADALHTVQDVARSVADVPNQLPELAKGVGLLASVFAYGAAVLAVVFLPPWKRKD